MNPPLSEASVTVDWLRYTVHWGTSALPNSMLKSSAARLATRCFPVSTNWKEAKARNGYNVALESMDIPGITVSWSSNRIEMGVSVDVPGSSLRECNILELLRLATRTGCRTSRIDLAVDIPSKANFTDLYKDFVAKMAVCKAQSARLITSTTGETVYVGSRSSEKYLRIYDKGAQMETNSEWTRVELECKADFARGITSYLAEHGLAGIPAIIREFCDFPYYLWWERWMTSPTLPVGVPKAEKQTNTFKWLMETVAPSLVTFLKENPDLRLTWAQRITALWGDDGRVGGVEPDIFDGRGDFD